MIPSLISYIILDVLYKEFVLALVSQNCESDMTNWSVIMLKINMLSHRHREETHA